MRTATGRRGAPVRCIHGTIHGTASALVVNPGAFLPIARPGGQPMDGVEPVLRGIDQLAFTIQTGRVRVFETVHGQDLADFAVVHVAGYPRPTAALLGAVAEYLRHNRVRAVNATGVFVSTKLFRCVRFAQGGVPVPNSVYFPGRLLDELADDIDESLGQPYVLKTLAASGGQFNYLVASGDELRERLRDPANAGQLFLAQEFVPSAATERILVFGTATPVVIRQTAVGATHLTGPLHGGRAQLVDPSDVDPVARRLAVRAAHLIDSEVASVTVIQHWTTGRWYVLDASANPTIGVGDFAGEITSAYSSYLRRRLGA
jgi:glutathione synthase/RimK-type ligase-like ATP-grasp enzyme